LVASCISLLKTRTDPATGKGSERRAAQLKLWIVSGPNGPVTGWALGCGLKLLRMSTERLQPANLRHPALARAVVTRLSDHQLGRNWTQLLMLTLLVWAGLIYGGIGSAMGSLPDVMANHVEARILAQLRQGGTSKASRWAQAEPGVEMSAWATVSSPPVLPHVPFAAALSFPSYWFEPAEPQAEQPMLAGLPERAALRWQTPLTRAPPFQAFQA
jgi:hypothetical protein